MPRDPAAPPSAVSAPPPVVVLSRSQVESLLPMEDCIDAVEEALTTLARGGSLQPLRIPMWLPDRRGLLGLMHGLAAPASLGLKVVSVFPHGSGDGGSTRDGDSARDSGSNEPAAAPALPSHQGVVLLFDAGRGNLRAILDAESITAIRTAAASALATRLLALEDAGDLALLGSGVQAHSHLEALRAVRPLRRVRVWSRSRERARAFSEAAGREHGLPVEPVPTAREAVEGADLVCTVTASPEPVLEGAWLSPGCHVNAVGACTPRARELDAEAVARARLFVDRRESALAEAGDFLLAREEGAVDEDHILGELGELALGRIEGRTGPEDVTLFESLGLAVEDLASAERVLARALERGAGERLDLAS